MISFRTGRYRFHYRAAAIVVDDGHLLLHRLQGDTFWALPGGRVEEGEAAADTIGREFMEELGLKVSVSTLATTGENFFEHEDEPHHEVALYFNASIGAECPLSDKSRIHMGTEGNKRLEFRWIRLADLAGTEMRPAALKHALSHGELPNHFVQRAQSDAA